MVPRDRARRTRLVSHPISIERNRLLGGDKIIDMIVVVVYWHCCVHRNVIVVVVVLVSCRH